MEEAKPAVNVLEHKPPGKPPPSQESTITVTKEDNQWVSDVTHQAQQEIQCQTNGKICSTNGHKYDINTWRRNNENIKNHLVTSKIKEHLESCNKYMTRHPQPSYLSIPTPKSVTHFATFT